MTSLQNLLTVLPDVILPQLKPLEIGALLLTSKSLYTVLSPSMETMYQLYFPNEIVEPSSTENEFYWTQRFLARAKARNVCTWGFNESNRLCLAPPFPTKPDGTMRTVVPITRSQVLSRLGVMKFAATGAWLIALSLEGKLYIMPPSEDELISEVLECEYRNEFIVDVAATKHTVFAISNTGRLFTWHVRMYSVRPRNLKLFDFNIGAVVRQKKARVTAITTSKFTAAFLVEDVGVVLWDERQYNEKAFLVPRLSNSLKPRWDVVDIGVKGGLLVLVLRNGSLFTYEFRLYYGRIIVYGPRQYNYFSEPVERVWCGRNRFFVRTRGKDLFEIKNKKKKPFITKPSMVMGIKAAHISMIAVGCNHNLALLNDGTLYAWGRGNYNVLGLFLERYPTGYCRCAHPEKMDIEHVVSVATGHDFSAAIIDPNEIMKRLRLRVSD